MTQSTPHSLPLIALPSDTLTDYASLAAPHDLAFWGDGDDRWNLNVDTLDDSCGEVLAQMVAASPMALEWHVRRIRHAYRRRQGSELYAALLDLLIALDGRGRELKKRMLAGAREVLSAEKFAALARIVNEGRLPPERDLPRAAGSRLSQGIEGVLELVEVATSPDHAPRDSLQEARECIEYSQLEQAKVLLETALIESPEREDLHLELLSLYRATRDEQGFVRMRQQMLQLRHRLPEAWLDQDAPIERGESR
ncbi:MAG: hypothetical protein H6R26_1084 [Proteobacteria bacterium]|nr:hypothetical protein [Pseudomonadota bacterium]